VVVEAGAKQAGIKVDAAERKEMMDAMSELLAGDLSMMVEQENAERALWITCRPSSVLL
jgi:hypothetical protein